MNHLDERLNALGRSLPPASDDFTNNVINQLTTNPPLPHPRRWIMKATIGLAASALLATFTWTLLVRTPQPAYGIDGVEQRLADAHSIHLAGTMADGSDFDIYMERPDRIYRRMSGTRVTSDASRVLFLDDRAKTATSSPGNPADARYLVQSLVENQVIAQLLGPAHQGLKKVRQDRVGDQPVDVYESTSAEGPAKLTTEVFLSPKTGLPVKSILWMQVNSPKREVLVTINQIQTDFPVPPGTFGFTIPPGYQPRTPAPNDAALIAGQGGTANDLHMLIRYAFNLHDRALVVCWSLYDEAHPADDLKLPAPGTFHVVANHGQFTQRTLRTDVDPADGHHWRWSLLTPPAGATAQPLAATFALHLPDTHLDFTIDGLSLDRPANQQLLLDAQRQTLPAGGQPLTLSALESEASKTPTAP